MTAHVSFAFPFGDPTKSALTEKCTYGKDVTFVHIFTIGETMLEIAGPETNQMRTL